MNSPYEGITIADLIVSNVSSNIKYTADFLAHLTRPDKQLQSIKKNINRILRDHKLLIKFS